MRKLFTVLTAIALMASCFILLPTEAEAAEIITSGTCGENLTWTLDDAGTLTISGTGMMADFHDPYGGYNTPWKNATSAIKRVVITAGVTSVGSSAFEECANLTSVVIPDSVTSIGGSAFSGCTNLTGVTIPDSVTIIGWSAFDGCTSLASVVIPDSVTNIGECAFRGCTSLTSIAIPSNVALIPKYAFSGCTSLASVTMGNGVVDIWDYAFHGCTSLASVMFLGSTPSIVRDAFEGCTLKDIYITDPIAWHRSNTNLTASHWHIIDASGREVTSFVIDNTVTSIPRNAFRGCTNLTSVTIPDSVTSIDEQAFYGCTNLTSITIPDSVTAIGRLAFSRHTKIRVDANNPNYSSDAQGVLFNKTKTTMIQVPLGITGAYAIPSSVTSIGGSTFDQCSNLTGVTIPDSVTSIGRFAFYQCSSLTSITIPNSVTIIDWSAFEGCTNLTSVTIPDSVTKIGGSAFSGCTSLWHVLYTGNEHYWQAIDIGSENRPLLLSTRHYNCTGNEITDVASKVCALCAPTCAHTYDNGCDTSCNVCGATRTITHGYKTTWSKDQANHWHECSVCKDKKDVAAHTPGAEATETTAQTCTTCGYVIKAALNHIHNYVNTWTTDANGHWYACDGCEEKGSYATHTPGTEATPTTDQTCTVCGHVLKEATGETESAPQPTEPSGTEATQPESTPATPTEPTTTPVAPTEPVGGNEPSTDSTVWIIVAVAVVLLGGGVAGIIIWKKKH